jgi:prepilin-type N-terminal cleavage/methylation domain-containing protein
MAGAMNNVRASFRSAGFSLIELIGVMAIIAILAAIAVPMTVRTIDQIAVRAEAATVNRIGEYLKLHLQRGGALPSSASWRADLLPLTDLSAASLEFNPRQVARVFLVEPVAASAQSTRVLILSSMRSGLILPATVNGAAFAEIWNTTDGKKPGTWTGWTEEQGEYLVIGRVSVAAELQTHTFRLLNSSNNSSLPSEIRPVGYVIVRPAGASLVQPIPPGGFADVAVRTGWRLDLFLDSTGTTLGYSYIANTRPRSFVFDGKAWTAP